MGDFVEDESREMIGDFNHLYTTIFEGSKKLYRKWVESGKVSEEMFNKFESFDPTPQKKYLEWMLKMHVEGYERTEHLGDMIRQYSRLDRTNRLEGDEKDIYTHKHPDELETSLTNAFQREQASKAKKGLERAGEFKEGVDIVTHRNDEHILVITPLTRRASVRYGTASWCTSYKDNPRYWHQHWGDGTNLYYIIDKTTKTRYAISVTVSGNMTIWDEKDHQQSPEWLAQQLSHIPDLDKLIPG